MKTLLDEIEPTWDVHEYHEAIVNAPPEVVYDTVIKFPAGGSMVERVLMALRGIPGRLLGRPRSKNAATATGRTLIETMRALGFVSGERAGEEIVLVLAGRFWQLAPQSVELNSLEEFMNYHEDGSARASMNFKVETHGDGRTLLSTETRVRCFGAGQRRFKIYWTLIGPFSAWIRRDWLRSIKHRSEAEIISKKLS